MDMFEGDTLGIFSDEPKKEGLDLKLLQQVESIGQSFMKHQKEKELRLRTLKAELEAERQELERAEQNLELIQQVRVVLQELSEKTREKILSGLETVVRKYVQAVFGESFDFEAKPRIVRGKMAIDFFVIDATNPDAIVRMVPEGNMGGGLLDTVAVALHFALIDMLEQPLQGPVFFDEPAKMVSNDLIYSIGQLIKQSQRIFGIQVIMITHHEQLQDIFDHAVVLRKEKGVVHVVS